MTFNYQKISDFFQEVIHMYAKRLLAVMLVAFSPMIFIGCDDGSGATEEENVIVPPGKADDFFSMTAQEYVLTGDSTVVLEDYYASRTEQERLERVKKLIEYKNVVIGWFLNVYIIDKSEHDDNPDYGGYHSLVKNGAWEDLEITKVDDLTYRFRFKQIIGGTTDLLSILPTTMGEDGKRHFTLKMGKISNYEMSQLETNYEWYRRSPWSDFDPDKVDPSKIEELDMVIEPEEASSDAWIDYKRLFEDGELTMAVHFGWDYHDDYHLKHSKELYDWLVNKMKFKSPVDSYDEYTRDSGPLTKTITANGQSVNVKIWIYWGKPGTETDPDTDAGGIVLENDMRESFRTKEVIVYSGHSGPFYGFALANWRKTYEGDLDDSEVPSLDMPSDVYQVVLAEGCDTYGLGQAFLMNPNKAGHHNIDVITTTNSSNAATPATVMDFIQAIVGSRWSKAVEAKKYSDVLKDMDSNSWWFNTMYGVHGIDDNPKMHPFADEAKLCQPCSKDEQCGEGMQCSRLNSNEKVCTAFCTDDTGCPEGYTCEYSAKGSYLRSKQCVPKGLSCQNPEPEESEVQVMINEVLADPPSSNEEGDMNGDGYRNASEDEFVEILNLSDSDVDISGWSISDSFTTRFTFPNGTVVPAHGVVVVFGGGDSSSFTLPEGVMAFSSKEIGGDYLGLTNSGDTVTLRDAMGKVIDQMTYGPEGGYDRSLTRATDGDPESSFIKHPGDSAASPGLKSDGSAF